MKIQSFRRGHSSNQNIIKTTLLTVLSRSPYISMLIRHVHVNIQRGSYIYAIYRDIYIYIYIYRRGNRRIWHFQFCSHCRVVEVIQSHGEHVTVYDRDSRNPHCRECARERSPVTLVDTRGRIFYRFTCRALRQREIGANFVLVLHFFPPRRTENA